MAMRVAPGKNGAAATAKRPVLRLRRKGTSHNVVVELAAVGVVAVLLGVVLLLRYAVDLGAPEVAQAPSSATNSSAPPIPVSPSKLRITNTDSEGAFLRRTTNLEDRLRAWPDGTELKLLGRDVVANGLTWKYVEDPAGNRGWIPAQYTEAL